MGIRDTSTGDHGDWKRGDGEHMSRGHTGRGHAPRTDPSPRAGGSRRWPRGEARKGWSCPPMAAAASGAAQGPAESAAAGRRNSPRAGGRWRLRSRTPSYCDESLFGTRPGQPAWALRMGRADVAKLHSLLWSPPPAPRCEPGLPSSSRCTLLPAGRPPDLAERAAAGSGATRRGRSCVCEHLEGCSDAGVRAAPPRGCSRSLGRSQSLSRLNASSDRPRLASGNARAERRENQGSPAASTAPPKWTRSKNVCGPPSAGNSLAGCGCKAKPPWR
ncbi:RBPJ-interacting and tubulin-associated protein 1 [Numida meleagris]|uniref:RBPJ-interacting and tubulin-associated protein 1 n=1 Tax=Numida meleagris TaxID=8996 RepID=UPI000B3DFFD0|nr:RBPJ-interacting and tubulin-associated protein 1 [Numida meleagris]